MKVILNSDVPSLGELGDVKEVALGYARNFLLPRGFALPYNQKTIALFERRKADIEKIKTQKRLESSDLKTRLEAEEISLILPAGANGKLYGAVTSATVVDELLRKGLTIDRKKIEIPGRAIKSVGNYRVAVRLYEKDEAVVRLTIRGQSDKEARAESAKSAPPPKAPRFQAVRAEPDEHGGDRLPRSRN
ncbi:MAG TPA: 50S ribosomal protein L9 [Magnetospirillaceae bacterium]|nr:50S ribosomal protein L9 [Magnetospirillaceae bacterium]